MAGIVETGIRIEEGDVKEARSSLAVILEDLANEPGQWKQYIVKNPSTATNIKRSKGFDARAFRRNPKSETDKMYILQACYKGPDFVAEFIPKTRKPKPTVGLL